MTRKVFDLLRTARVGAFLTVALLLVGTSVNAGSDPFPTANRTIPVRLLGLPNAEDSRWLAFDTSRQQWSVEHTSQFSVDDEGAEQLFLDGETTGLTWSGRFAIRPHWVMGIEVPLLSHQSGFMDSFVEGWHRTFDLPNARREEFPRNRLLFAVDTPRGQARLSSAATGLGDVAMLLRRQWRAGNAEWAAQLRLEAPTGRASDMLGSGSWDTALGVSVFSQQHTGTGSTSLHAQFGALLPGRASLLPRLQRDWAAYASATAAWCCYRERVQLKVQLDGHSALYDTDIKSLGGHSLQLSFGASIALNKRLQFNIGLSEDVAVRTAPDFTVLLGLSVQR